MLAGTKRPAESSAGTVSTSSSRSFADPTVGDDVAHPPLAARGVPFTFLATDAGSDPAAALAQLAVIVEAEKAVLLEEAQLVRARLEQTYNRTRVADAYAQAQHARVEAAAAAAMTEAGSEAADGSSSSEGSGQSGGRGGWGQLDVSGEAMAAAAAAVHARAGSSSGVAGAGAAGTATRASSSMTDDGEENVASSGAGAPVATSAAAVEGTEGGVGPGGAALSRYTGRPIHGYTSGALYVSAEGEAGFPPPQREGWRYPHESGANVALAFGPSSGGSGSAELPTAKAAKAALKRPRWPDRGYPVPASASSSAYLRAVAIASDFDAAAAAEATRIERHLGVLGLLAGK